MGVLQKNFDLYSSYYDLLYSDKDYELESDYVLSIIKTFKPNGKAILELGSGTGNYAACFCKAGYSVLGIEHSEQMIALSNKKDIEGFTAIHGDIKEFGNHGKFEIAVALFHVMSYLTQNADLLSCFKSVYNHLEERGIFIFDVWYSPAVYTLVPEHRTKNYSNDDIEVARKASPTMLPQQNIVHVHYDIEIKEKTSQEVFNIEELHVMRHFSTPEIELFAQLSGFKVVRSEAFLTQQIPDTGTWGVCYTLQKI